MATFAIDQAHTDVLFSAKHLMVTNVRGKFTEVRGTVEVNEADPTASHAELSVAAASVDTGFGARDTHLRSNDFFAVETYPEILVMTTAITPRGGSDYVVTADVTVKGVTRPVDFDVEFLGFFTGMDGSRRAGFHARAKINRKDWGLDWNVALETGGWLVGDQITLDIDLAFQEAIALAA